MNELTPEDEKLDALLKTWSQDHASDSATIDRLHQAILATTRPGAAQALAAPSRRQWHPSTVESLAAQSSRQWHPTEPQRPSRRSSAMAIWFTAACLFVAVLASFAVRSDKKPEIASSDPRAKSRLAALWKETGNLFGSNLRWLGDLDGELLLGVNGPHDAPTDDRRVCLSLEMRVLNSKTGAWEKSWTGNFTCEGGSTVNFASEGNRSTGSIWVQAQPDGRFAISHWLNWQDHPQLSGPVETTVSTDQPQVVVEGVEEGRRIQVVQQVWRPDVG